MMVSSGSVYFDKATEGDRGPCVTRDKNPLPVGVTVFTVECESGLSVYLKDSSREIVYGHATIDESGAGIFSEASFYNNIPGDEAEILMTSVLTLMKPEINNGTCSLAMATLEDISEEGVIYAAGHKIKVDIEPVVHLLNLPEITQPQEKLEAVA